MNTLQNKIERLIKHRLEKTKDCTFKKDWIPKGWTCIKDKVFIAEVSKEIEELLERYLER